MLTFLHLERVEMHPAELTNVKNKHIHMVGWTGSSPNLNPFENLLSLLKNEASGRKHSRLVEV